MHDDHDHGSPEAGASNPWPDRVNEAYYDGMGADFGQRTRDRINWMCANATGASALDVGCSQGIASILMAREGMRVVGIDIFRPAIDYALGERAKEIESVRERLEFRCVELAHLAGETFDTVLMGEVIEHQTNPVRFIRQAAALVAPGGRLVITVPFGLHPWPDHKSTVFPRDVATAVQDGFVLRELDVEGGYIRAVADRVGSNASSDDLALKATEKGALESQSRFYASSRNEQKLTRDVAQLEQRCKATDSAQQAALERERQAQSKAHAQEITGLESALAQSTQHAEREQQLAVELATHKALATHREQAIAALQQAHQADQNRLIELQQAHDADQRRIAELQQAQDADQQRLGELLRAIEARHGQVSDLTRQLAEREHAHDGLVDRLSAAERECGAHTAELAHARDELEASKQRLEGLRHAEERLRQQMKDVQVELAVAQHKRTGHFAHLQAERERSAKLVELAARLHEENQRYRHSVALALGQALLGLRSPRGIVGFPRALWRAVRGYRQRERGQAFAPLELPRLAHVSLPPAPRAASAGRTAPEPAAFPDDAAGAAKALSIAGWPHQELPADKLPVMSVLDEFSRTCFAPHAALIEPRPDNWEGLLDAQRPRLLFVESSWKGNYGTWQYRVARYANPPGGELAELVEGCRARGIPTVFWNKEDPVHFDNFIDGAMRFDLVLTTAAEAVPRYQDRANGRVGVLQFAAEESLHNPVGSAQRNDKVCFAGSFYANRFQERRDDQLMLLDAASGFDLDIFDRNHDPQAKAPSDFAFPERFSRFVRGRLPYSEIGGAYRQYRVFLNVNSVIDSPTMFSRRVFELLACGTPVVSTWARGSEDTFGPDLVWHVRDREEAEEAIRVLMTDDREWRRRSLAGIRAVMAAHTYRHRFQQVLGMLGLDAPARDRFGDVLVVAEAGDQSEADAVLAAFQRQQLEAGVSARLLLATPGHGQVSASGRGVEVAESMEGGIAQALERSRRAGPERLVASMSPRALYGRHYLQDLLAAARYSGADVVGKPADGQAASQYRFDVALDPWGRLGVESAFDGSGNARGGDPAMSGLRAYAADTANFLRLDRIPEDTDALFQEIEL